MTANETRLDLFEDIPDFVEIEGEMTVSSAGRKQNTAKIGTPEFNTLDEPIKDTVLRDIRAVGVKFLCVLYPVEKSNILKEWDLWGPLVLCTLMATILQGSAEEPHDGGPEFAQVFVIVWIGSMIVTFNSKLLGGNISFFQSVCVLGYCLMPIAASLVICRIVLLLTQSRLLFFVRFVTAMGGFAWATYASYIFLGNSQPPNRKSLAVYPIFLFYFILSWLVLSHTS